MGTPRSFFYGKVLADGTIKLDEGEKERMNNAATLYANKEIVITLEAKRYSKTQKQNGYYHACIKPFVQQVLKEEGFNLTKDQVHHWLVNKFMDTQVLKSPHQLPVLESIELPKDYSEADLEQTSEFINRIADFFMEIFGAEMPPPKKGVIEDKTAKNNNNQNTEQK